jgi:copper transport protein
MAVFLGASIGQLFVQGAQVDGSSALGTILAQTDWGRYWLWRMGLFILVAVSLGVLAVSRRPSTWTRTSLKVLALAAASGLLLTLSLVSHGAAISGVRVGAVLSDYLHLLAAGFWVGGLIHFAVGMPLLVGKLAPQERNAALSGMVPRFSTLAVLSVGTLIVTGIYSAWAQVTVVPAVATPYGVTLLVKVALIVPLLLFGALNLLWVRPRLSKDAQAGKWLRWFVTSEAILAALVLLAVGLLTSLEPARQVASRQGIGLPKSLDFEDTAEGATIKLAIDPGQLGSNLFIISLTDRFDRPITNATEVMVELTYLDQDIGNSVIPAIDHGGGLWLAHGGLLSIAGRWQASLTVRRPDAFDARTAFRFQVASGAGSAAILPAPNTGKLLLGVELVLLGLLFLGVGLSLGGWWTRRGAGVMGPGAAAVLAGLFLVTNVQLTSTQTPLSNPFPPNPQSLEVGKQIYTQSCQVCHGVTGRGDGPLAATLNPKPLDLTVHVPLHPEAQLYTFISKGIPGTAMAAWEKSLTPEEIWHVINYLQTLTPQER